LDDSFEARGENDSDLMDGEKIVVKKKKKALPRKIRGQNDRQDAVGMG